MVGIIPIMDHPYKVCVLQSCQVYRVAKCPLSNHTVIVQYLVDLCDKQNTGRMNMSMIFNIHCVSKREHQTHSTNSVKS